MKFVKLLLSLLFTSIMINSMAQVGIGTTTPDAEAILDIQSNDKGMLVPRLADHTTITPTSGSDYGLLVFDTTTKSFWYWDGTVWSEVWSTTGSNAWELTGNSGTSPGANYMGTSDNQDVILSRNTTEEIRILTDQVSINDATPIAGDRFTVVGDSDEYAINGYGTGSNGIGIYGSGSRGVIGTGGIGVFGTVNGSSYFGVIANNDDTSGVGMIASGGNALLSYLPATGATLNAPDLAAAGFSTSASGTGLSGIGNGGTTSYTLSGGSGVAGSGTDAGVYGIGLDSDGGTGVVGVGNDGTAATLAQGSGIAGTGYSVGVYGIATRTNQSRFGGYFESDGSYAYVGGVDNNTDRKILGNGTVSTIVKGVNGDLLTMSCPEAPEILFQDYGVGKLENGFARILIDPNLSKNIRVDSEHPLKVFIQLEGDCKGVYVTNKSKNGFDVKELQKGKSNVAFSWSIVATRADETRALRNGNTRISKNGGRFQPAPAALSAEKNNIDRREALTPKIKSINK